MNFQKLLVVENFQTYLDIAFGNASRQASKLRNNLKVKSKLTKSKAVERERVRVVSSSLVKLFDNIVESYPRFDELPDFYKELACCVLNVDKLKKSLGAINWVKKRVSLLGKEYSSKINRNRVLSNFVSIRQEFYGRVSSVVKQISTDLLNLENARKTMKKFPALKTSMFTVVIAGAPNVGKSSLLAILTGTKPKIALYPFTTKSLNLGYDKKNNIQFVDTPGLLDRSLLKRNNIEKQAIIALDKVADLIVFIVDPSETCGYGVDEQKNILKEVKKSFKTEVLIVVNKTDLVCKDFKADFLVSLKENKGVVELKEKIVSFISSRKSLK